MRQKSRDIYSLWFERVKIQKIYEWHLVTKYEKTAWYLDLMRFIKVLVFMTMFLQILQISKIHFRKFGVIFHR